jgi:hypothetical protein
MGVGWRGWMFRKLRRRDLFFLVFKLERENSLSWSVRSESEIRERGRFKGVLLTEVMGWGKRLDALELKRISVLDCIGFV